MQEVSITEVPGILIGHAHDLNAATGCTAIICKEGAVAGVDVRGGAPGTRETDLLQPENLTNAIHSVVLAGGSAFGLAAATGAAEWLEEQGVGFDVMVTKVPLVCSAVLFDLMIGDYRVRPDAAMGRAACENAGKPQQMEGCVGAGAGATVGKLLGPETSMKSGLGCYCLKSQDVVVGSIVAVNCLGDVIDPESREMLAGLLSPDKKSLAGTEKAMLESFLKASDLFAGNTTIGVVVTNATLTKPQARKLAVMAHNGYARAMRPAHSMYDGDTIFSMATGKTKADLSTLGMLAARTMERAVVRAVMTATPLHGYLCAADLARR
ncbi:MAG: P1 family peptidase [Thermodesulfobacteriota bacterium]